MIIKSLLYIVVLLTLLTLTSCDPLMDLNLKVQNNSSEELIVEFKALHNSNKDTTIVLNSGSESTILNTSRREKAKHYDCCPCEVGSLNIYTLDTSETIIKDYKNVDNWVKINENKSKVICILELYDEDLE